MDDKLLVETLKKENEQLRERVAFLEASLVYEKPLPLEWQLTNSEAKLVGALLVRPILNKEQLHAVLYAGKTNSDANTELKIVDVLICKARKKLGVFGINIETAWGKGYFISEACRNRFRSLQSARESLNATESPGSFMNVS